MLLFFFFKQKTAYEMRISDWSSDVCSSDLDPALAGVPKSAFNYSKIRTAQPLADEAELAIHKSSIKELLIVDRNIKDYRQFGRLVKSGVELVEIPQGVDGLAFLLETLAQYEQLHAVHLFSHAHAGALLLEIGRVHV